jgi:Sulfotransferase family
LTPEASARKDPPDDGRTVATMDTTGEVDRILADAVEHAGLDDFGESWFLGPLSAYAVDLEQPNLTEFGRQFLRTRAVLDLVRRLRVLETLRQHPEIAAVPIPPIVYITGLERSGTTLLHNLLALHRDARVLRRWELLEPVPPPETETFDTDARIARVQAQADVLRGTLLEHMHWVNATDPRSACAGSSIRCRSSPGLRARACPRGGGS